MIKYYWIDLLWLLGLVLSNYLFYTIDSSTNHYFILNLIALSTFFVVGYLNYELYKEKQK
ncbi:hypothetical protein LCGC14_1254870 [marine sediment metagenome]|uniref:Uncharacterized protein n=1 Tax=marine sediment metagenome TaxID=412755 RepID=A0A0F9LNR1_9ZZZZ